MTYFIRAKALIILKRQGIWILTVLMLFSSCRSHKDLTLMRDLKGKSLVPRSVIDYRYKIKVNDNLYVSIVSTNPELNEIYNPATIGTRAGSNANVWESVQNQFVHGYLVDLDGSITLPTLGQIHVLGLTVLECETEIQSKANQYLKNVTAKVRLLNFKVTVLGEVTNPGVYYNYNPEFTVLDAISVAGGIKNTALLSNVLVLRQLGDKSQTFELDLNSANALTSDAFNIQPNDIVIIQPARFKNLELKLPIYSLILSSITTFLLVLNYVQVFR